ncbi:MAG: pilus assembly protein TadG-related protein [Nocardioidaceae bacterium]|nr:pilus assembly protein TadG-related protein [Nocardioidaceae bacterium]
MTPRWRDERGSITPFTIIVLIALLALAGLVIDGGRQLNAKGRAVAYAQEAARAGVQSIDLALQVEFVNKERAERVISAYCEQAQAADERLTTCEPDITEPADVLGNVDVIGVRTEVTTNPILLNMFGVGPLMSSAQAQARPIGGVTEADSGDIESNPPPSLGEPGDPGFSSLPPGEVTTPPSEAVPTCIEPPDDDDPPGGTPADPPSDDQPEPPEQPDQPGQPGQDEEEPDDGPTGPICVSSAPTVPVQPTQPTVPTETTEPTDPIDPAEPPADEGAQP